MRSLHLIDLVEALESGKKIRVIAPMVQTTEGNVALFGNLYEGSRRIPFAATLSKANYEILQSKANTYKARKEGV